MCGLRNIWECVFTSPTPIPPGKGTCGEHQQTYQAVHIKRYGHQYYHGQKSHNHTGKIYKRPMKKINYSNPKKEFYIHYS